MSKPICERCKNEFEHSGRGRKPRVCPECSISGLKVDMLEMMLKARGTHISQQEQK